MVELPIPSTSGAPSKATRSVRVLSLATDDDASSSDEDQSIPSQLDRSGEGSSRPHAFGHAPNSKINAIVYSSLNTSSPSRHVSLRRGPPSEEAASSHRAELNHARARRPPMASSQPQPDDTDSSYFHVGEHLDDSGSDDDLGAASQIRPAGTLDLAEDSEEGRERIEWQSMLASVLSGDVLQGESSRQGLNEPSRGMLKKALGQSLWWQIRAKIRGRGEDEEVRRVEDRRGRIVDSVLEEVDKFTVEKNLGPAGIGRRLSSEDNGQSEESDHQSELSALDQTNYILEKLGVVESLYPHHRALRAAKPLYNSEAFQSRVNALSSWSTIVTSLQNQLAILQKWTGSDDLDITRPNTTKEKALVTKNRYHPLDNKAKAQAAAANDLAADDSTFLERVMKEDNLQRTFEKRVFVDMLALIHHAKETVILYSPLFNELNLPDYQYELVRLIGFPGRLIIEALKVRLDAAAKLVDPNPMVVNDMIDNFRLSISLAVLIKRQYEDIVSSDADQKWTIPACLAPEYDLVLLEGLRTFFRLLHWKLKSGARAMYFKETEVLEDEWEFLYEAAEAVNGGDLVVAEHFCSLTNKLMVRVSSFFDTQLQVPVPVSSPKAGGKRHTRARSLQPDPDAKNREHREMTPEEMLSWFGKILEAIKMRYRKLQRFAWRLTNRHNNSAEYDLDNQDVDLLVQILQDSGHFLVYTRVFEDRGTYVVADGALWNDNAAIQQLLTSAYISTLSRPKRPETDSPDEQERNLPDGADNNEDNETTGDGVDDATYLLLLSPRQNFAWTGAVMTIELDQPDLELDLEDSRVRLIADGPAARLAMCKRLFGDSLLNPETGDPIVNLACTVPQQAHLPRIQRELKKIARSTQRFNESIIQSAAHVRHTLGGTAGTQEMTQNWYAFASDHGRKVRGFVPAVSWPRFSRLCMRLAISWVSFICDHCDPTDRKTFRWTVNALKNAYEVTEGRNILHLDHNEFALFRKSVAALVSFLILHFDILGARSSMEAKREAERVEAMRRLQRLQEDIDDDLFPQKGMPPGRGKFSADRSIRLAREERLRLIEELESRRIGFNNDQHLIGQVLDEQVSEDRALVFLAASSSNIALRWQQGAFIGGGANGNVYIGFNLDSGGIMAVKEIRVQDLSNSPQLYKQIKDESDVMSMLQHPNIVEYYGIEVHRDRVYIFEEYCEGGSLADLLEHGRVEDEEVVMVYALQMLQGLEYLHSKGIEHRDVKPDNILLGTNSTIKFVDFGAAKVIVKGNKTMARTRAANKPRAQVADGAAVMNSLAGTPMYMAPEVIKNEKAGRLGASDIWSMGCCLLEIATGRKPWSNLDNEWAIMFHIGIATQHPPLPEPGQLSDLGIEFIELCVTLDPTERPSASELLYHPWLAVMVQQMTDHTQDGSTGSGEPSNSSTLVDESDPSAQTAADMAKLQCDTWSQDTTPDE